MKMWQQILKFSFFPYYLTSVIVAIALLSQGANRVHVLLGLLVSTLSFNFIIENIIPVSKKALPRPYLKDSSMVLTNIGMTAVIGDFLMLIAITGASDFFLKFAVFSELTKLNMVWQVPIAFLLVELIRYQIHFYQHHIPFLWIWHATHHRVPEIYSLNNYFTHPIDYLLRNVLAFPLIALIGFSYETIGIVSVLSTVGIFSHSAADLKHGIFNYIFSTNHLHRWHHSVIPAESNTNFGTSLMIWDQVFGTYFNPKDRKHPDQYGV